MSKLIINKRILFSQTPKKDFFNDIEILVGNKNPPDNIWGVYADGYKEAANLICEQIINKRVLKKYAMIYPAIYLYRHYLELQFKNIIILTNKALSLLSTQDESEKEMKYPSNHNLLNLYEACLDNLKKFAIKIEGPEAINEQEDFLELKKIIQEFEQYDKFSQSFRYPKNQKNNFNLQKIDIINIKNVYDVINKGTEAFDGIESWLDVRIDLIKDYLNYGI